MISRGALNGATLNAYALDRGGFVVEVSAAASVAMTGALDLVARRAMSASAIVPIAATSALHRRAVMGAASSIPLPAAATLVRRRRTDGAADIAVAGSLMVHRRARLAASTVAELDASATLGWHVIFWASRRRRMVLPGPARSVTIAADRRGISVPPSARTIVVPPTVRAAA